MDRMEYAIILAFDVVRNFLIHRLIEWRLLMLLKILVMRMLIMSVVAIAASA